jgi:hypothetical protein
MTATYRYRQERRFAKPAAAIWPFISDTARLWELSGFASYRFDERVDGEGRVRRFVKARWDRFRRDGRRILANGRRIAAFSKSESTETARCGGGSGLASSLPKARAVGWL